MDEDESDGLGFERGFEVSRQCNALHKYNILVGDFPDEVILHTGRISNRPEKYEPCESLDEEEESESASITSIISTELECSDADSKGNLEGFVSYSSDEESSCWNIIKLLLHKYSKHEHAFVSHLPWLHSIRLEQIRRWSKKTKNFSKL